MNVPQRLQVVNAVGRCPPSNSSDQDRIYVTGLSMGGFGTWSLAGLSRDRFAALVPFCGDGDPNTVRRLAHIPVWVVFVFFVVDCDPSSRRNCRRVRGDGR